MLSKPKELNIYTDDEDFDLIYPEKIRDLAPQQWTPVDVALMASRFLAEEPGAKVLDIGSGVGKFCLIGASCTQGVFTGAEQRDYLVSISNKMAEKYDIARASFIHANITDVDFSQYDSFYFFNAFYENIDKAAVIDDTVERGFGLYKVYTRYVSGQLAKMKIGTRLATYWSPVDQVPEGYELRFAAFEHNLKCWIKVR